MIEISKADWKLFREKVPIWQERYMEQLTKEYINLLSSPGYASAHFWELDKRIKKDRKHPGVILEMRKPNAVWDIVGFLRQDIISWEDLNGFSQELIDVIKDIESR